MAILDKAWGNPKTNLLQIVAPGGVGKTQLVKKWREGLLGKDDCGGAARAFDWSFYSQGTQQQASADEFFDKALRWFGETELEKYKDPWAKGERLAALAKGQRTLLILDGLEPLQHPPGPLHGELSDPSLQSLLRGLCDGNPGLCLVTTREAVPDLEHMQPPRCVTINLNTLNEADGAQLLKLYGVHGSDKELWQASADVDGHSLALVLLATYLAMKCGGDVSRRTEALLFEGHERYAAHAHKVMASYEAWFAKQDDIGRVAVVILRLMGLFNRPADPGCLAALRAEPPIPGLTEPLFKGDRDELWTRAVERLRHARLLADYSNRKSEIANRQSLDAHPLIREHFAIQLAEKLPGAAREAHRRIYGHLIGSARKLPDSLSEMMPLYQAVVHGCQAGLVQQALNLFIDRICRDPSSSYSTRQLGAIAENLGALSWFFERKWSVLLAQMSNGEGRWVLNESALCLIALGRVHEAREALKASRSMCRHWREASETAGSLSDLECLQGELSRAISLAQDAVTHSDRGEDQFCRMGARFLLANALSLGGRPQEARKLYEWAESMQKEVQPNYPILYSEQGFRFCELLLMQVECEAWRRTIGSEAKGETPRDYVTNRDPVSQLIQQCAAVLERAERTLDWARSLGMLREIGLDHTTLARSALYRELLSQSQMADVRSAIANSEIERHADSGVLTLRQSGMSNLLPLGLLCRAWVRFLLGNAEGSEADLKETEEISERGPMPLFLSDVLLYRARLFRDRAELAKAEALLSNMQANGYHRRDQELADAIEEAKKW